MRIYAVLKIGHLSLKPCVLFIICYNQEMQSQTLNYQESNDFKYVNTSIF